MEKPKDVKVVSTKWIYTIKKDADGYIQRYKARFVARGFSQIEGVNVNETYSPVIRTESIRLLLNIAIENFKSKTIRYNHCFSECPLIFVSYCLCALWIVKFVSNLIWSYKKMILICFFHFIDFVFGGGAKIAVDYHITRANEKFLKS